MKPLDRLSLATGLSVIAITAMLFSVGQWRMAAAFSIVAGLAIIVFAVLARHRASDCNA